MMSARSTTSRTTGRPVHHHNRLKRRGLRLAVGLQLLEMDAAQVVAALPREWQAAARVVVQAWARAGRASSAVENWHSILRPHLAVHRTVSPGLLVLLAVWHNHRVFRRGVHKGSSPAQLSGLIDAPTDWLVVLGYPPASSHARPAGAGADELALAA